MCITWSIQKRLGKEGRLETGLGLGLGLDLDPEKGRLAFTAHPVWFLEGRAGGRGRCEEKSEDREYIK